jgi:hypothetical protein
MATRPRELIAEAGRLSGAERRELLRAWAALPAVWFGLRVLPLRRLLRTPAVPAAEGHGGANTARGAARLVNAAARFSPFPHSCLSRSIVLWRLLQRRGVAAEIRVGVRRDRGPMAAHAWVEVDGEPVNDAPDVAERHAVFERGLSPKT